MLEHVGKSNGHMGCHAVAHMNMGSDFHCDSQDKQKRIRKNSHIFVNISGEIKQRSLRLWAVQHFRAE